MLGRMYRLRFGRSENPLAGATLRIVDNADQDVGAGGDTALSPDNTDNNGSEMLVCEDGTTASRAVMAAKGRDGSLWIIISPAPVRQSSTRRVATALS